MRETWGVELGVGVAYGFKAVDRDQQFLLPPDVREWLPEGHLAWLVLEVVEQLDVSAIEASYRLGGRGRQAYDPSMLLSLLLYGYGIGVRSSRRIERACETDVAFRVIAANLRPDHATIARFRAAHQDAIAGVFAQVLGVCARAGLVDGRLVAVDSTKIAANAAATANMTREQLEEHARQVLEEAAAIDAAEDEQFGPQRRGDELPERLAPGPDRARRIRQALDELDRATSHERAVAQRQQARVAAGGKPMGRPPLPADPSKPWRHASKPSGRKVNVTDPDSRSLKAPGRFVQGYTAQAATTRDQLIVAVDVSNDQNDSRALLPMLRQTIDNLAHAQAAAPKVAVADTGYWHAADIDAIETDLDITALVATVRTRALRHDAPSDPPLQPTMTRMHRRFRHPTAQRYYRQRATMIEPVFGHHKHNLGLTRFLRRGLDAVRAEWTLAATAHNLTKLWRATAAAA